MSGYLMPVVMSDGRVYKTWKVIKRNGPAEAWTTNRTGQKHWIEGVNCIFINTIINKNEEGNN